MSSVSFLNPSCTEAYWTQLLDTLPSIANDLPADALLRGGRNEVYRIEHAGHSLVLKRFANKGAWKKIAYKISTSKARRSYEHSLKLMEIGLLSPKPICWREDWASGWLRESYYVSAFVDYEHDANALSDPSTADWQRKATLAGEIIGKMHEAKVEHLDFNSGNLLFKQDAQGEWQGFVIDNNRMRMGAVPPNRGIKALFLMGLENEPLNLLIEAYAKTRKLDLANCRAKYFKTLKRHTLKWRIKNRTRPWRRKFGL